MLGDEQRKTIILFTDAIAALCAPSQDAAKIEHLKEQVNVALARLERDFPLPLQVRLQCKCLKSIVSWVLLLLETKTFSWSHTCDRLNLTSVLKWGVYAGLTSFIRDFNMPVTTLGGSGGVAILLSLKGGIITVI